MPRLNQKGGDLQSSSYNSNTNITLAQGSGPNPGALGNGLFPNNIYQKAGGCASCGGNLVGGKRRKKRGGKTAKKSGRKNKSGGKTRRGGG